MRRRGAGEKKSKALPDEYVQLEYLNCVNNYLATDYVPSARCKIELTYKGNSIYANKAGAIFGCRDGYRENAVYFRTYASSGSATTTTCEFGWGNEATAVSENAFDANDKHVYGVYNGVFYVDDTIIYTFTTTVSPNFELYIFGINDAGSKLNVSTPMGYIYKVQIWDNDGKLVRDYIPAKRLNDNQEGLFDFVNGQFITKL